MLKIEKNVPLPSRGRRIKTKYRLEEMKVGDSIKCSCPPETMRAYIFQWKKKSADRLDMKFSVFLEKKGCRYWRTK